MLTLHVLSRTSGFFRDKWMKKKCTSSSWFQLVTSLELRPCGLEENGSFSTIEKCWKPHPVLRGTYVFRLIVRSILNMASSMAKNRAGTSPKGNRHMIGGPEGLPGGVEKYKWTSFNLQSMCLIWFLCYMGHKKHVLIEKLIIKKEW